MLIISDVIISFANQHLKKAIKYLLKQYNQLLHQ